MSTSSGSARWICLERRERGWAACGVAADAGDADLPFSGEAVGEALSDAVIRRFLVTLPPTVAEAVVGVGLPYAARASGEAALARATRKLSVA